MNFKHIAPSFVLTNTDKPNVPNNWMHKRPHSQSSAWTQFHHWHSRSTSSSFRFECTLPPKLTLFQSSRTSIPSSTFCPVDFLLSRNFRFLSSSNSNCSFSFLNLRRSISSITVSSSNVASPNNRPIPHKLKGKGTSSARAFVLRALYRALRFRRRFRMPGVERPALSRWIWVRARRHAAWTLIAAVVSYDKK